MPIRLTALDTRDGLLGLGQRLVPRSRLEEPVLEGLRHPWLKELPPPDSGPGFLWATF